MPEVPHDVLERLLVSLLDDRFAAIHNDLELVRQLATATLTEAQATNGRVTRLEGVVQPLLDEHDEEVVLRRVAASRRKRSAWALGLIASVAAIAAAVASLVSALHG